MDRPILVQTNDRRLVAKAAEEGFRQFLLDQAPDGLGRVDAFLLRGDVIHHKGRPVGRFVRIRSGRDERAVRALKGNADIVVVETSDWKVIPLENLIAALGGKPKLYAVARTPEEARLFFGTLERGVDGIVIRPKTVADLRRFRDVAAADVAPAALVPATITRIEPVGLGERVCVDTANLFRPGEGLLVGSTGQAFFLVAAECYETEYVAARPFRVNASAVHAYVWNGDKTHYLSEVRAGLALRAVDSKGRVRTVVVGRAKVETRPLLLVEADAGGQRASILLQNAETIRLVTPSGRVKSVSRLKVGDRVLVHPESGARHFGMKVQETIREV